MIIISRFQWLISYLSSICKKKLSCGRIIHGDHFHAFSFARRFSTGPCIFGCKAVFPLHFIPFAIMFNIDRWVTFRGTCRGSGSRSWCGSWGRSRGGSWGRGRSGSSNGCGSYCFTKKVLKMIPFMIDKM